MIWLDWLLLITVTVLFGAAVLLFVRWGVR